MSDALGPDAFTGATPDNALRNSNRAEGPMLAADGTPLKRSLARALRREKIRALALIAPLLLFILVTFIAPIADMLFRSVENQIVGETLPRTVVALRDWDGSGVPGEAAYDALAADMLEAVERKEHTRLGSRLNYETTGLSSLFRKSGRGVDEIGKDTEAAFEALDPAWKDPSTWADLMAAPAWLEKAAAAMDADETLPPFKLRGGVATALPHSAEAYLSFARITIEVDEDNPAEERPWPWVYRALRADLVEDPGSAIAAAGSLKDLVRTAADAAPSMPMTPTPAAFLEIDEDWGDHAVWGTIKAFSGDYTSGYFLAAADLKKTPDGIALSPPNERIYVMLFKRTMIMSLIITGSCILLGYPVAFLLASLPMRTSNVLMILVLLPFWTSLLVRTSAWKILLQQQGVINDTLVWMGLVSDANRLVLINNQTGTIIAMTHILLPFMILPLYSVMKGIPPSYVRAAKSLGATDWTAFWRVYFPQSVPGIGAGSILVFILSIGYYITPELVGGTTGTFISNRIAYHISSSLNWGLAAALGTILLAFVLALYWVYDRIVGIDNVSLG